MYSIGLERLAYVLGDGLGLPIPTTYLEECEGQRGCAQLLVPAPAWKHVVAGIPTMWNGEFLNRDVWPLGVVFDIWLANPDRHDRNILVQPDPPETRPAIATRSRTWLIDHGNACLWPPGKFGTYGNISSIRLRADGSMKPHLDKEIGISMPKEISESFTSLAAGARQPFLDRITAITDDEIASAVGEVPSHYFSSGARDLTIDLLTARRDQIGTLSEEVFPIPADGK